MDAALLRRAYDREAPGYDARFAAQQRTRYQAMGRWVTAPTGGVVLDLGGGTGMLREALVGLDPAWAAVPFVAVDLSAGMLSRARQRGLTCVQADARRLPFATGMASRVLCVSGLVDAGDVARALVAAARVCADEGQVAFCLLPGTVPDAIEETGSRLPLVLETRAECGADRLFVWRRRPRDR